MTLPMAAVSAAEEPDISEKKMVATITTMPMPPRMCPTMALDNSTMRLEIPPVSISMPARTKSGTAR